VADSNRFNALGATESLAIVSVPAALSGKPALIGYIRAGAFPRDIPCCLVAGRYWSLTRVLAR